MAEPGAGGGTPGLAWSGVSDKRSYYRLFTGYVVALIATGIATVALALLAFNLAGEESGTVIGTALSLKMLAYVLAAPVVAILTEGIPRRQLLIGLDLLRAACLVLLPFVTQVWQVHAIVFVFALASATFSFVYLAIVPHLLGDEADYYRSLSRARVAAELEGPISPLVAGLLMAVLSVAGIFTLAAAGFVLSALLVRAARMPRTLASPTGNAWRRLTRGPRLFVAVPAFRAIIAMDVVAALGTAMVMVNTVVIVQGLLDREVGSTASAFAFLGAGSILGALVLPGVLSRVRDRNVMLTGALIVVASLASGALSFGIAGLLLRWVAIGLGVVWTITPAIYLIRRLARPADLQVLMAAQMTLANLCLLIAFPVAGFLGAWASMSATFLILAALSGLATLAMIRLWPEDVTPDI
ncbi:MFS transporter [Cereibacter sphaeroides]|uniref:MFS transporter n=1 Tax=Cereibacter sphaeroides TaxID=1063 RepID=UPI001F164ADA|nr:MFS transporter [Cereibacter sphaeroides]MCE6960608.1 MFS transporter [Cereibacter sphaeroides]MCE6970125.1 MFS transporter [Cereibacter sphaeroides]MCE6971438.1 MFS transporter [Cereibacter sphaeroides]